MRSRPPRRGFWDDDESDPQDAERGRANRLKVLEDLVAYAMSGQPIDAGCVAVWHRDCFVGLSHVATRDEVLLGAYRGSDHPRLRRMIVTVDGIPGADPDDVRSEVGRFFDTLNARVDRLTTQIDAQRDKSRAELLRVAALAGWAHGQWVRIHPFANGSGRTARLIANWVLVRFRLLPVVGIRPRPGQPYGEAAAASMGGDHQRITEYIVRLLEHATDQDR